MNKKQFVSIVDKYYFTAKKTPSDINEHLEALCLEVYKNRPTTILELGVRGGNSTIALMMGLLHYPAKLLKTVKFVSVDLEPPTDYGKFLLDNKKHLPFWEFIQSNDLLVDYGKVFDGRTVDLIFLDTSHQYQDTVNEIAEFLPLMTPTGAMYFHDTVSCPDVNRAIEECVRRNPFLVYSNVTNNNGLGRIIYRRDV